MFLINPYIYSSGEAEPVGGNDTYTVLLLNCDGADESTTFTDTSVGSSTHTVTANADAQVDTAIKKFGTGSALLDGTGDYLSVPDSEDWDFGDGDFVIDCWIKSTITDSFDIIGQGTDSDNTWKLYVASGGELRFLDRASATNKVMITSTETMTTDWTHVALVRSGTSFFIYINGEKDATITGNSESITEYSSTLNIGYAGLYYLNGHIDEVRISKGTDRGWTGATFTVPTSAYSYTMDISDYIAMYKFADNGDDEAGSHDATMSNVTYSDTDGITDQGKYGIFNGTTSYGQITDHADITDLKTVSAWIYLSGWGEGSAGRITEKGSSTTFSVDSATGNLQLTKGFASGATSGLWQTDAGSVALGIWCHVAYTYAMDNNVVTNPVIYVNGSSVTVSETTSPVGTMDSDTGSDLYIGNRSANDRTFDGRIDNMRFYDRILIPTEIEAIYDAEKQDAIPGNDAYTVLLLNCDGADESTTFTDTSVGGSTHTVTANADAQVDTAIKKFGTGSALLDGTGDYLSMPDSADWSFGTDDFVIDFWLKSTITDSFDIIGQGTDSDNTWKL